MSVCLDEYAGMLLIGTHTLIHLHALEGRFHARPAQLQLSHAYAPHAPHTQPHTSFTRDPPNYQLLHAYAQHAPHTQPHAGFTRDPPNYNHHDGSVDIGVLVMLFRDGCV